MVIDFRIRPPYKSFLNLSISNPNRQSSTMLGVPPAASFLRQSFDLFLEEMDAAGIDLGVIMGRQTKSEFGDVHNADIAELVHTYPGRFAGFGAVYPWPIRAGVEEVRRCIEEHGLKGIVLDPGGLDKPLKADDSPLYPLYEHCAAYGVPVALAQSVLIAPTIDYVLPSAIQRVAQDFPELSIIVSHAAWPWAMEMIGVAFKHKNVFLLPDFYMHIPQMPGASHFVEAANYFLENQLLYGSAYPVRPLLHSLKEFRQLPLKPGVIDKATRVNALRLLNIESDLID